MKYFYMEKHLNPLRTWSKKFQRRTGCPL